MGLCASTDATPAAGGKAGSTASPSNQEKGGKVTPASAAAKPNGSTEDRYQIIKVLGMGASCKVVLVRGKSNPGQQYALKILEKKEEHKDSKHLWTTEVNILKKLRHPNILEFVDAYEDPASFNLVTAYCAGGELFDKVVDMKLFSEQEAAKLTKSMLLALQHCHANSIVHRDLKPENFVFEHEGTIADMKLIDFGCALQVADDQVVKDVAGSPYYVAPEVLIGDYKRVGKVWKASDMWSVGVIVFLLVHGYPPFNGNTQEEIFARIRRAQPPKRNKQIKLSEEVWDLMMKLLQPDPSKRLTADEALQHPWFSAATPDPLPKKVAKNIKNFQVQCKLKKAVGKALVDKMTDSDKALLADVFKKYDRNGDGHLDATEIAAMMNDIGMPPSEGDQLLAQYDDDKSGGLDVNEFKNAHGVGMLSNDTVITEAFNAFDSDGDGVVTTTELEVMLNISPAEAKQLLGEVDKDGNGTLDMNEWVTALRVQRKKKSQGK